MKKTEKPKLGLIGVNATDLVAKGRALVSGCTGNPNLSLPPDFLTEMAAHCDALEAANIAVRDNGGKRDTFIRRSRVEDVQDQVRILASFVQAQCGRDGVKIASTGFELRRRPRPVGVLEAPGNLRAMRGNLPGEVILRWEAVHGRIHYGLEVNVGDLRNEADWKTLARTGRNSFTATGLETDKPYSFRVFAVSAAGEGKVSDSAHSKAA